MNELALPRRREPEPPGRPRVASVDEPVERASLPGRAEDAKPSAAAATPWVASTYFGEGLPYSIVHQIAAEMFTALGVSLQAIGLTAFYGLAWNAKGVWAPILDMYSTTRRWLIGLELALVLAVGGVAWFAGRNDLGSVAIALVAVAFLGATQDIAIDGFYMRALDKDQQASLSGLRVGAYRAALLVGKGLLVILAGLTSWRACFLAAAGIMLALAALHTSILPREERRPKEASPLSFWSAFSTFFTQRNVAWTVAFIVLYRAGDALMFAMSTPLLKSLGLDTAARGALSGVFGTAISVSGSVVGGLLIGRLGLARTLRPITAIQSLAILLYVWMAWAKPGLLGIGLVVLVEQFAAGIGTAALMVFLMRRSAGEYKTSHFAIASSLMSLGTTFLGGASGFMVSALGFPVFFAIAFAASIPGVILSFKVPTD